ncbi:TetR/AcrR family transcriptional regulator [Streptomyces sp. NPDC093085]|uniref:TetR/AcrR family transcriptional regulator n=1 Tax=Streptomyces sp. NPDC093085 TaxID=3155068 RepID=UPI003428DC49
MAAPSASRRKAGPRQQPVSVERIEAAAIELFGEKTYPVVGMRDISDAVGILPGSLYVHIRKKEDILLRIVERGIENYLEAIEAAVKPGTSGPDRMRRAIVAHMCVLAGTLQQTRVTFHQWTYLSPPQQERVVELRGRYEEIFTRILRTGIRKKEFRRVKHPRIAVLAIIGMLNSATEWYSPDGELSPEAVGHLLADSALGGLVRQPAA